ncbi:transposable element Tc3 transposase [Trichonephila clavipes]|nr:transposable element Tc3 transposase [Trichonephila clavipes]
MVWADIMINGRTRVHVVANGTMTGQRYIDEVLLPHVRLFRGAVGDKFVFMDDNAACHRTLAVQDCLESEGIQRLVWPARFPDLNPIENVWDDLGRQVAGRNYPPTNKNTLIRALTEEWDKLPQQLLDYVVQSMIVAIVWRGFTLVSTESCFCESDSASVDVVSDAYELDSPAQSTDMNSIESDELEHRLQARPMHSKLEEWISKNIPAKLVCCGSHEKKVPAQMSSTSLDHDSKLRGPSQEAFV